MTTPEADEQGKTAPIEPSGHQPPPSPPVPAPPPEPEHAQPAESAPSRPAETPSATTVAAPAEAPVVAAPEPLPHPEPEPAPTPAASLVAATEPIAGVQQREVVYVPLAVNIGDGFKFGCGFFLAGVLASLVGFVLLAALFLLTGLLGLNLPLGR